MFVLTALWNMCSLWCFLRSHSGSNDRSCFICETLDVNSWIQVLGGIREYFKQRKDTLPQEHRTKSKQAKQFIAWKTMFNLLLGGYM